jgi:hypothetical protein
MEVREAKLWIKGTIDELAAKSEAQAESRWWSTRTRDGRFRLSVDLIQGRKKKEAKEDYFSEDDLTELGDPTLQGKMERRLKKWLGF